MIAKVVEASWIRSTGMVVVLAALRGGLSLPKRAMETSLPSRVVAGFVADAVIAGFLQDERPVLGQVVVGRHVDLGGEADESEDGGVGQINDLCSGRAELRQPLGVDQRLWDHPAWPQQAPELLDEGANWLLGEVASAWLSEIEPAIRADIEEPGGDIGGMDSPQRSRPELQAGKLGQVVRRSGQAARTQRFRSATVR